MNHDHRLDSFQKHVDATRQHEVDRVVESLKQKLKKKSNDYDTLLSEIACLRDQLSISLALENDAAIDRKPIEPRLSSKKNEASVYALISDVHPFETVLPEQVSGVNHFTPTICEARMVKLFQKIVMWSNIHRAGVEIKTCILGFLGDLIGNMLHREQVEMNAGTPMEEILFMVDILLSGIEYIWKHGGFDEIIILCSHGNHDRGLDHFDKRKNIGNQAKHAHTWVLYHFLKKWIQENTDWNVRFEIATGYHLLQNVYGRTVRQHHGDAVRYRDGVGGPSIPLKKKIDRWNTAPGNDADLDAFGHLHWSMIDQVYAGNGSVIGYSSYSVENGFPYEPPTQLLILLDKEHWATSFNRIYV